MYIFLKQYNSTGGQELRDEIQENFKHPDLLYAKSQMPAELDIFVPSLKLAFEYQGAQHVQQMYTGNIDAQSARDEEKKRLCRLHGITLVCIHHQWSGLLEDLLATVHHYSPEKLGQVIVPPEGKVIPPKPPKARPRRSVKGEPPFMLSKKYSADLESTNWYY